MECKFFFLILKNYLFMFTKNLSNTLKDTRFNLGQTVNPNLVFVANDRVDDIVPATLDLA